MKRPKYPESSPNLPKRHWVFWSNYRNTLGLSEKLPKYPWAFGKITKIPLEVGMVFSWAFLILGFSILVFFDFGLLIIN
jgi:hypothetical protein